MLCLVNYKKIFQMRSIQMKGRVRWAGERQFIAESGSGHTVVIDGPPDHGGRNIGIRPMEMMLLGLGGCSNFDVINILEKARQPVTSCEVYLEAERAETEPKVFTKIHMHFVVKGKNLKEAHIKRAIDLSAEKYCSAAAMLRAGSVEITHDYELIEQA